MTKLEELSKLIEQAKQYQDLYDQQEKSLKKTQELIAQIIETDIPHLMDSLGIDKILTNDGWEVKIDERYHARISEANKNTAFTWLRNNGHGSLIKNNVSVEFGAGEDKDALVLVEDLTDNGFQVTMKEGVNSRTLEGFVNEQKKQGANIPDDVFGIFHKRQAKVKRKN